MNHIIPILLTLLILTGCAPDTPQPTPTQTDSSPPSTSAGNEADPANGEALFTHGKGGAPNCLSCHRTGATGPTQGPLLDGIAERAASRVPGLPAEDYLHASIVDPSVYIVSGYRDLMYPLYGRDMTEQEIADIVAYLMQR